MFHLHSMILAPRSQQRPRHWISLAWAGTTTTTPFYPSSCKTEAVRTRVDSAGRSVPDACFSLLPQQAGSPSLRCRHLLCHAGGQASGRTVPPPRTHRRAEQSPHLIDVASSSRRSSPEASKFRDELPTWQEGPSARGPEVSPADPLFLPLVEVMLSGLEEPRIIPTTTSLGIWWCPPPQTRNGYDLDLGGVGEVEGVWHAFHREESRHGQCLRLG